MNILQQSAFDIDLNLDPAFCNWFVGWIDGEGCFRSVVEKHNRGMRCELEVSVRDDDLNLVTTVMNTLRCGYMVRAPARSPRHGAQVYWYCADTGACRNILIPLLDKYPLRSKKQRDYGIWRELVLAISGGHHLNGNRDYILSLCQQLKDIKKYIPPNP